MAVLPDEKAVDSWHSLTAWFQAAGPQAPVVLMVAWEHVREELLRTLSVQDHYILETEKRTIAIEHVRVMISATASTTPFGKRLIAIPEAQRLSLPAAQALLKFLEEPTAGNRLLLTTKFPRRLLPTIRSRVQILRINTPQVPGTDSSGVESGSFALDPVKLLTSKNRRALTEDELASITHITQQRIEAGDSTPAVYRTLLRLRDYYKIRSLGGNEKLAADVLLASLVELEAGR